MNGVQVVQLFRILKLKNIRPRAGWVIASCPFAPKFHERGQDARPSFGVSTRGASYYHCFSCHRKGPLSMLPTAMEMVLKQPTPAEARMLILEHNHNILGEYDELGGEDPNSVAPLWPKKIYYGFPYPDPKILKELKRNTGITEASVKARGLRFDTEEHRILFPIRDMNRRLVGVRGRYIGWERKTARGNYREYDPGEFRLRGSHTFHRRTKLPPRERGIKGYGTWYGMKPLGHPNAPVILVEGERDRIMLLQAYPFKYVWASMGASISRMQLYSLTGLRNPVVIFMDDDAAGRLAAQKIRARMRRLTTVYQIENYSNCKDPAEIVEKRKLRQAIKSIYKVY